MPELPDVEAIRERVERRGLGPDPYRVDFGADQFRPVLRRRGGSIKSTLMNQRMLAGVGYAYMDEALFQAGLHPHRIVGLDLRGLDGRPRRLMVIRESCR